MADAGADAGVDVYVVFCLTDYLLGMRMGMGLGVLVFVLVWRGKEEQKGFWDRVFFLCQLARRIKIQLLEYQSMKEAEQQSKERAKCQRAHGGPYLFSFFSLSNTTLMQSLLPPRPLGRLPKFSQRYHPPHMKPPTLLKELL